MKFHRVYAPAVITMLALADPRLAQTPRTPDDLIPSLDRQRDDASRSKSDAQRLVGKVLEIDQARGMVTLETEEGRRVVKPSPNLLAAIRIGDTISVPRTEDQPVNASPRTR
jgi:hypothetical protein